MTNLRLDYHYGNEAEQYSFYRIPKILFTDERFKSLSLDARVLYGLMLDRMALSIKNNWLDDKNRVFIYFTLEDACVFMGQSHSKMVRIMAELDGKKGIGLIERKKQGQGKPTIIYVKNFSSLEMTENKTKTEPKKYSKPNFKTYHNEKSKQENKNKTEEKEHSFVGNPVENSDLVEDFLPFYSEQCNKTSVPEVQTSENDISSLHKKGSQDLSNWNANNTKLNNTYLSDTESINQSKEVEHEKVDKNKQITIDRIDERNMYTEIIKENIAYDYFVDQKPYDTEKITGIVELMLDVVCSNKKITHISGQDIPTKVVKSRFLKLDSSHIEYVLDCLSNNTTKVHNIKAYLLTSLYNAPTTISGYYSALVNYDMYGSANENRQ